LCSLQDAVDQAGGADVHLSHVLMAHRGDAREPREKIDQIRDWILEGAPNN
jgi:hypothetical protein